jgi:hypothetical protein
MDEVGRANKQDKYLEGIYLVYTGINMTALVVRNKIKWTFST